MLLEIKPMLLQWQKIKPNIYIYTSSSSNEQYNTSSFNSFTFFHIQTIVNCCKPSLPFLQLDFESPMLSSQFHLNIS